MLSDIMPAVLGLGMLGAMLYGAFYPERFVAARRSAMSPRPLDPSEIKLVRALTLFVIIVCGWTGYATGTWLLPLIFVPLSLGLALVVELSRRPGFPNLAKKQIPARLIGVGLILMAGAMWMQSRIAIAPFIAIVGAAFVRFPALGTWGMTMGMTEEQEIVHTRVTGILTSILISSVAIAVLWRVFGHPLLQQIAGTSR